MKTITRIIAILLVAVLSNASLSQAQTLTEDQKEQLRERVKQKVEEFQYSLSKIVDMSLGKSDDAHRIRMEHRQDLFNLFIERCEPYDIYDYQLGRKVHSNGVKMQTSSVNRLRKTSNTMKNYIDKLYNPQTRKLAYNYDVINIDSVNAVRVDNIERVGDHYECVAYFCQKFIGYKDGRIWYSDVTTKKVRCYITPLTLPGESQPIWEAKLGDMYVLETKRVGKS